MSRHVHMPCSSFLMFLIRVALREHDSCRHGLHVFRTVTVCVDDSDRLMFAHAWCAVRISTCADALALAFVCECNVRFDVVSPLKWLCMSNFSSVNATRWSKLFEGAVCCIDELCVACCCSFFDLWL